LIVSVCVPVRNEAHSLARLLTSLLAQVPPPAEILIVDGGSTDDTVAVARSLSAQQGVRVREIGPAFPGRGRNEAALEARNEWLAFIDAGCTAEPGWLAALIEAARSGPADTRAVFGDYAPRLSSEWDVAQALALVQPRGPDGCRPWVIASALIHRSAWEAAGRFPEEMRAAEDLLFFERLVAAGVVAVRAPKATIRWNLAPGPLGVFRRLRLYSAYHLAAGLGRTWHHRVFAMDLGFLVLAVAGAWLRPAWLALAVLLTARLVKTILGRRGSAEGRFAFRPDRVLRVAWLLVVADAATWVGAFGRWLGRVPPR
jgi:glycosyltransferase involved in cell wall biosynthesis